MPTTTANYSLNKPLVNDPVDEDLWGGYLNDDLDDVDTLLRAGITIAAQSSQTAGFTATASISVKNLYPCDATSAAFAATLPTAASAGNGSVVVFKKTDSTSNAITITRASSDTIDGATTLALSLQYQFAILVSDGVNKWHIVSKIPANFVGDSGSGGAAGLVPAPVTGDATKFLRGDGVFATPNYSTPILAQGYITNLSSSPSAAGASNIASISRTSAGVYAVSFTSAAADTNFVVTGTVTNATYNDMFICEITSVTTGGFTFKTKTTSNDLFDPDNVRLIVFKGA